MTVVWKPKKDSRLSDESHVDLKYIPGADGFSYEREALEEWFERGKYTSPMTNLDVSPEVRLNPIKHNKIKSINSLNFCRIKLF